MKLVVKHGKETCELDCGAEAKVEDVMAQLETLTGVITRKQKLIFQGKVLLPSQTLEAAKLKEGSKLMLMAGTGVQTQGQLAAQQVVKERAAAAKERSENFREQQRAKAARLAQGAGSDSSLQARSKAWAKTGIITLRDSELDSLPDEVCSIGAAARIADVGGNRVAHLPVGFTALSGLQRLRLSHNCLTDDVFGVLTQLPQLAVLALDHNRITQVSASIGSLQLLQRLLLSHNQITSLDPAVTSLPSLVHLDLRSNQLTSLPEHWAGCPVLAELDLASNRLEVLPEGLASLQALRTIVLDSNRLRHIPAAIFRRCSALATVSVHLNPLTVEQLREMDGFAEFGVRLRAKYEKQMEMRVMAPSNGFDEGADAIDWHHWGG
ncbi:hypothetical protein WJX72_010701 [[Myrmecia] bisecta]|uniref:Ubiquitin-like domain-containing protein n=1 Tax=[Myrmecia] bisecta TaxID=41462 RepID=A0AAW1PB25_9CHLO